LAQAVMRDHPEIVRSVVLDSVVPTDVGVYGELSTASMLQVLFDGCAADPACNAAYPDLETVYNDLVAQLDDEPAVAELEMVSTGQTYTATVNGARLMNAVLWALRSPYMIRQMPQAIYEARDGDYTFLGYGLGFQRGVYDHINLGMMISVDCHDHAFASTPEALDALVAEYRLHEALGDTSITGEEIMSFCDKWGAAPFDPRDGEPLYSTIPTLILAGEYDSTTPPLFGRRVGETLPSSFYFEFPGEGHAPSAGDNCALGIALAFINDPALEPDSACIAEMDGPHFVVP
jgi:pimeloyl-ACP methyl ester carboxylesterase